MSPTIMAKNKFYYCFWGSCALLLVAGQIYVGTSYRYMAQTFFVEKRTVCFSLPNKSKDLKYTDPSVEDVGPTKTDSNNLLWRDNPQLPIDRWQ